jgi:hypothetical protein
VRKWLTDENVADLKARAQKLAERFLADPTKPPRVLPAIGFVRGELNGQVSQIVWDQSSVRTTFTLRHFARPTSGAAGGQVARRAIETGGGGAASYPHQAATQDNRSAESQAGSTPPMVPVDPIESPPPAQPNLAIAQVKGLMAVGWYQLKIGTGSLTGNPGTTVTPDDPGAPVTPAPDATGSHPLMMPPTDLKFEGDADAIGFLAKEAVQSLSETSGSRALSVGQYVFVQLLGVLGNGAKGCAIIDASGGLPIPTALNQIVICTMFTSPTNYEWEADYVKASP